MKALLIDEISNDQLRTKVADVCLDYGLPRIQYSAFFGELSQWDRPVRRGFVHFNPIRASQEVPIASNMRSFTTQALSRPRAHLLADGLLPPTRVRARCRECAFRSFCNDVDVGD